MTDDLTINDFQSRDPLSFLKNPTDRKHVLGWVKTVQTHMRENQRIPYFVTVTYKEAKDYPLTPAVASHSVGRFYRNLSRWLFDTRHIERQRYRPFEPILFAFIDVPGSKPKHYQLHATPTRESTFHHHCILLAHDSHVMKLDALETSPEARAAVLEKLSHACNVRTLDVQRTRVSDTDLIRTTDYCTYHSRKRTDEHALQVYPIARSERKNKKKEQFQ